MTVYTPPMGYNTWNTFGAEINEKLLIELADALVSTGLRDIGYDYLVIDDCWAEKERDENGKMVPDKNKFPNGMKAVSDYIHSKGLKFGMYSCVGTMTCAGYPGSFGHEYVDAETFKEWGIDFLKYDYCFRSKKTEGVDLYRKMAIALKNTGRDILFSACSWGHDDTHKWIDTTGANMWRATGDIKDSWEHIKKLAFEGIDINNVNYMNCFSDLDMLIVGMNGKGFCSITGCTVEEYKTHFLFWAFFGSPLMIGCDIRNMDDDTVKILTNKEIIGINQDKELNRPFRLRSGDTMEDDHEVRVYAKILENGDIALGFFNFSDNRVHNRFVTLDMIGLDADTDIEITVKNLWTGEYNKVINDTVKVSVIEPHASEIYRISIKQK